MYVLPMPSPVAAEPAVCPTRLAVQAPIAIALMTMRLDVGVRASSVKRVGALSVAPPAIATV